MNNITKKSNKSYHNVYLYDNHCILEVRRNGLYYIYEIENGNATLLIEESSVPYTPEVGKKAEDYYLDYLSCDNVQKINILTSNFDYSDLINSLIIIVKTIESNYYDYCDFNMQMAYVFEDVKDTLGQLAEFSQDSQYSVLYKEYESFFDIYFYNRKSALIDNEIITIKQKFNKLIKFLKTLTISN